jgi:hypothetical protein
LYDEVDCGLGNRGGLIVSSQQYFHFSVVGIDAEFDYVGAASGITLLATVEPLSPEV